MKGKRPEARLADFECFALGLMLGTAARLGQVDFATIDAGLSKDYLKAHNSVVIWPAGLQPR